MLPLYRRRSQPHWRCSAPRFLAPRFFVSGWCGAGAADAIVSPDDKRDAFRRRLLSWTEKIESRGDREKTAASPIGNPDNQYLMLDTTWIGPINRARPECAAKDHAIDARDAQRDLPLHTRLHLLAECGRELLFQDHPPAHPPRRLPLDTAPDDGSVEPAERGEQSRRAPGFRRVAAAGSRERLRRFRDGRPEPSIPAKSGAISTRGD
jgi:hypothetical protein